MSAQRKWYITTAIDYANGPPHLGHALEKVGADAMARYRRLRGESVHFVIGMDEHGIKVQQSAEAAGVSPQAWVDGIAQAFSAMWQRLAISNDDFMRTTQPRHTRCATELVRRIQAADDVYPGRYEGYYCVGCESFKRDDELIRDEGGTIRCPIHLLRTLEWTVEENWFFRLSKYADALLRLYDENPGFIRPESRYNEVRRLVESGLEDISISRAQVEWGIPWPGAEGHVIYVWIEALINYLSASGFPGPGWDAIWPADVHVIGKDITRFHCVIWPAMLMSAGLPLPRSVWAHGFVNFSGRKLSKSEGVRIELSDMIERWGADAFRYYLLRDVPWNGDGDFSLERFDVRYTADLADTLGNLANRTISMIERYRQACVPAGDRTALDDAIDAAVERFREAMDADLLHQGAQTAMELAIAANGFVEERAPWSQAKDAAQASALNATLASLARATAALSTLLEPFLPGTMRALAHRLGLDAPPMLAELRALQLTGRTVHRGEILFPKPKPA